MSTDYVIETRALCKRYGRKLALDRLDLAIPRGRIHAIVGANGAGKSTLFRILLGFMPPSAGEARIKGISLHYAPTAAKQHLGYLPEQPPVYPELTVDEYLRYCAGLHGIASKARAEAVRLAKQSCGLADVCGRLIARLLAIAHRAAIQAAEGAVAALAPPAAARELHRQAGIDLLPEDHRLLFGEVI